MLLPTAVSLSRTIISNALTCHLYQYWFFVQVPALASSHHFTSLISCRLHPAFPSFGVSPCRERSPTHTHKSSTLQLSLRVVLKNLRPPSIHAWLIGTDTKEAGHWNRGCKRDPTSLKPPAWISCANVPLSAEWWRSRNPTAFPKIWPLPPTFSTIC